jgi:hypothetical protein
MIDCWRRNLRRIAQLSPIRAEDVRLIQQMAPLTPERVAVPVLPPEPAPRGKCRYTQDRPRVTCYPPLAFWR